MAVQVNWSVYCQSVLMKRIAALRRTRPFAICGMSARQGIQLDRSTVADWVGRAAWYLCPLRDHILKRLRSSERLFADETTASALDPGRKRTTKLVRSVPGATSHGRGLKERRSGLKVHAGLGPLYFALGRISSPC